MPEFLTEFIQDLSSKSSQIIETFENQKFNHIYKDIFQNFWRFYELKESKPKQNFIVINSSRVVFPVIYGSLFTLLNY